MDKPRPPIRVPSHLLMQQIYTGGVTTSYGLRECSTALIRKFTRRRAPEAGSDHLGTGARGVELAAL